MTGRLLLLLLLVVNRHSRLIKLLLPLLDQLILLMQMQQRVYTLGEVVHIEELLHLVGIVVVISV